MSVKVDYFSTEVKMKKEKLHFIILTSIYVAIMVWGILLKMNRFGLIEHNFKYMIKLDLFSRLTYSLNPFSMHATTIKENYLNIFAFIPFGFLSSAIFENRTLIKTAFSSFLLSLIFEIIQVFTAIGGFATIDLICNTFGGLLGFLAFALVMHYLKQGSEKVQNTLVKSFIVACYVFLTPIALYGVFNTLINLDSYIALYL